MVKKAKNHFDDCYLLCSQHQGNQQQEKESVGLCKPRVYNLANFTLL